MSIKPPIHEMPRNFQIGEVAPPGKVWVTYRGKLEDVEIHESREVAEFRAEQRSEGKVQFVSRLMESDLLPPPNKLHPPIHPIPPAILERMSAEEKRENLIYRSYRLNNAGTAPGKPAYAQLHKTEAEAKEAVDRRNQLALQYHKGGKVPARYTYIAQAKDLRKFNLGGSREGAGAPAKPPEVTVRNDWSGLYLNKPAWELFEEYKAAACAEIPPGKSNPSRSKLVAELVCSSLSKAKLYSRPVYDDRELNKRYDKMIRFRVNDSINEQLVARMESMGLESKQEFIFRCVWTALLDWKESLNN